MWLSIIYWAITLFSFYKNMFIIDNILKYLKL